MTDINPAITVIICMYKGEATVCRMIDCVLNQTFKDFELILVDDGSPDRCGEIADEYSKKDNTVYVLEKMNNSNDEMIEELNDLELTWALKIPKIDLVARN